MVGGGERERVGGEGGGLRERRREEGSGSFSSNLRKLKQTRKNVVARFFFGWF